MSNNNILRITLILASLVLLSMACTTTGTSESVDITPTAEVEEEPLVWLTIYSDFTFNLWQYEEGEKVIIDTWCYDSRPEKQCKTSPDATKLDLYDFFAIENREDFIRQSLIIDDGQGVLNLLLQSDIPTDALVTEYR